MKWLGPLVFFGFIVLVFFAAAQIPSPHDRILSKLAEQEEPLTMYFILPDGRLSTGEWTWGRDEKGRRTVTVRWEQE